MTLSIMEKLKLGSLSSTSLAIQMVYRSLNYSKGIIEDVLVKVDKFTFHVDFFIRDMEEDIEVLIILGLPFLVPWHALIDLH